MKRIFWLIGCVILAGQTAFALVTAEAGTLTRPWLRQKFELAENDPKATREMILIIEQKGILHDGDCPAIVKSYYGALETLEAKDSFNPAKKIILLNAGMKLLAQAIIATPEDLEVRFVRCATLQHLPAFLGYRDLRMQDLNRTYEMLLERDYSVVERPMQLKMTDFLLASDRLTHSQEQAMSELRRELEGK